MRVCPDELICDFAETYGVYDWRSLPLVTAATLAQGLPASSRVARKLTGTRTTDDRTVLLAVIADKLAHIAWMFSKDGADGINHPPSILKQLLVSQPERTGGFATGEEFDAAWAAITGTQGGEADG